MKGTNGDMGDSGVPGEAVRKIDLILHFLLPFSEDTRWPVVVEIKMFQLLPKSLQQLSTDNIFLTLHCTTWTLLELD